MHWVTRIVLVVTSLLLGLAAFVQINDPDAASWIVFYSLPAILTFVYAVSRDPYDLSVWQKLLLADILFSVVFISLQVNSTNLTDLGLTTEAGRELMGTTLSILWIVTLFLHSLRFVGSTAIFGNVFLILALCAYYSYVVAFTDIQLEDHCKGVLGSIQS